MSKLSLSVDPRVRKPMKAVVQGPADLRDQRWLDERIESARSGIEAVIDIALNWTEGRNVSRLHPGVAASDYVRERVGLVGREAIIPLLTESNWSNRQIAAVAGVTHPTVAAVRTGNDLPVRPETLGADGVVRSYPAREPTAAPDQRWNPGAGLMSSETPEWYTPKRVLSAVVQALGAIDLDPCAEPAKSVPATQHFTEADDGLAREWMGRVYMNPPYGRGIGDWTSKLRSEHEAGRVTEAVALIPARTETDWWNEVGAEWFCLIHGRLAFSDHDTSAPFPSAALYLGPSPEVFTTAFYRLGDVCQVRKGYEP